jgi:hypothetical protein
MEHPLNEHISGRNRSESVTMSETELLAGNLDKGRLLQTLHSQFLKIAISPYIMIAGKEINIHTSFNQILDGGKDTDISLRNNIPILVPEIPYIPEKIERLRILRKRTKKIHETTLPGSRTGNLEAEMDI